MANGILCGVILAVGLMLSVCIYTSHGQAACTVNGRIPTVPGNCSNTYVLCYNPNPNGSGNFSQWTYTCPGTSVFNEVTQRCSLACPVTTTTTTTTTTPATTINPNP